MADRKAEQTIAKKSPTRFYFVSLLLVLSLVSIYEQDKLLQIHLLDTSSNDGSDRSIPRRMISNYDLLFGDAKGSAKIILRASQLKRPIFDRAIRHDVERARCARYKLGYDPNARRRRIFWGAMIADDSWHAIATQAMEAYGLFHTVAFVESNRTQMTNTRPLRFDESSANKRLLTRTGMFGPDAKVTVDYYVNEDTETLVGLEREHAQRSVILERWKKNGMTADDIGYLSDADEIFSRDFLRAMQICNVPQFVSDGKDGHNKCVAPKVYGLVTIFEGSPECVSSEEIYHPALMIGECIEGIGDATLHARPSRYRNIPTNWRHDNYTYETRYSALHDETNPPPPKSLPSNVHFPLWNAADYRRCSGGFFYGADDPPLFIGWHVHNFFDRDLKTMRNKYLTYGHPISDALTKPLSDMNRQVNLMVRCSKNDTTFELEGPASRKYKTNDQRRKFPIAIKKGGLGFLRKANYGVDTGGAIPLAFRLKDYVTARHKEMVASVEKDEKERLQTIETMHDKK